MSDMNGLSEEKKFMNCGVQFFTGLKSILDFLKDNPYYKAEFDNMKIIYKDTVEDTANGKREYYVIERKIKQ